MQVSSWLCRLARSAGGRPRKRGAHAAATNPGGDPVTTISYWVGTHWSEDASNAERVVTPDRPTGDEVDDRFEWYMQGHLHRDHAPPAPASRRTVRVIAAVLVPIAVATVVAMVMLWPSHDRIGDDGATGDAPRFEAVVVSVVQEPCPSAPDDKSSPARPDGLRCGRVTVRMQEGPDRFKRVDTEIPSGSGAPKVSVGDEVIVMALPDDVNGGLTYSIIDHQRRKPLSALAVAFALAVVTFGRWRGVRALAGLAVTFSVLLLFIVPAIMDGRPPLLVAIVGSAAIMLSVLFLTHGFTVTTAMAVFGTLASLCLTGVLSAVSVWLSRLNGVASDEANFLSISLQNVNMQGLLLAGILIGSLGVLDDVCVTQAATVTELVQANPELGLRKTYRAATRIGRAHIASVINTIILAYAGASLPVLILLTAANQPVGRLLTSQFLAEEIVRSVVGTIGLIAAVPITTALATVATRRLAARP